MNSQTCGHIPTRWYHTYPIPRDGNCLFHAVRAHINTYSVTQLRKMVCAELHHPIYLPYTGGRVPKDHNFSWFSTYGDIAPYALASTLQMSFLVITDTVAYYVHPRTGPTPAPIYVHLANGHYSAVQPKEILLLWEDQFFTDATEATEATEAELT